VLMIRTPAAFRWGEPGARQHRPTRRGRCGPRPRGSTMIPG